MSSILIAVPTFETINSETYESIFAVNNLTNADIDFKAIKGYDCARARNEIVKYFLNSEQNYDYLWMVDSDIILPTKSFIYTAYLDQKYDILLGWYPRKNDPQYSELFKDGYNGYPPKARWACDDIRNYPYEMFQVKGGGFGCAIIPRRVLEAIEHPRFKYWVRDDGSYKSEDLYFCDQANEHGFKIYAVKDLACDHIGRRIVKAVR